MYNIDYFGSKKDPHILCVKNFFDDNELDGIWQELSFLTYRHKLLPPTSTNTAMFEGKSLKQNSGIFLESTFADKNISNILTILEKTYECGFLEYLMEYDPIFRYMMYCKRKSTLLSYYQNGDYYKKHWDVSTISVLFYFFEEPKCFSGGDLYFTDFDKKIEIENNMIVIFPSCYRHEVDTVIMEGEEFNKKGRYCISQFLFSD